MARHFLLVAVYLMISSTIWAAQETYDASSDPEIQSVTRISDSNLQCILQGTGISVSAKISDLQNTNELFLKWSVNDTDLDNTLAMEQVATTDIYVTTSDIPFQTDDNTVYYAVSIIHNGQEIISPIQSYFIDPFICPPVGLVIGDGITEIMIAPSAVNDEQGEYFELYNGTEDPINIEGWTLKDDGTDLHTITSGAPLEIPSGGFLVLGTNADPATNDGVQVDYQYAGMVLDNDEDEIILVDTEGTERFRVAYTSSDPWPEITAAALVFNGSSSELGYSNSTGTLWSSATASRGLNSGLGSPGLEGTDQFLSNVFTYKESFWLPQSPPIDAPETKLIIEKGFPELDISHLTSIQTRETGVLNLGSSSLTLSGDILNKGALISANDGTIIAQNDLKQTFKGSGQLQIGGLRLINPEGLLNFLETDIFSVVDLVDGDLTIEGAFTFKSNSENTAMLEELGETASITGSVIVERFILGKKAFRLLTSPVTTASSININWQEGALSTTENPNPGFGMHITGATTDDNGFDYIPSEFPSLRKANNDLQTFEELSDTNINTLSTGETFLTLISGSRAVDITDFDSPADDTVLRAQGLLTTGSSTQNFITTQEGLDTSGPGNSFMVIGNPYQSSVDMTTVLQDNSQNINPNFYYVYDPQAYGPDSLGGIVTVDLSDGTNTSYSDANQFLQVGQGAFLSVIDDEPGITTSVVFQENDKNVGQITNTSSPQFSESILTTRLFTTDSTENTLVDSFKIEFSSEYENSITLNDAPKPPNLFENLAISKDGRLLSVERRDFPIDDELINLNVTNYQKSTHTLEMDLDDLGSITAYLVDSFLETETELNPGINSIAFDVSAEGGDAPDRFSLRFSDENLGLDNFSKEVFSMYPNPYEDGELVIYYTEIENRKVQVLITNVLGQYMFHSTQTFSNGQLRLDNINHLPSGMYFVKLSSARLSMTKSLIIK